MSSNQPSVASIFASGKGLGAPNRQRNAFKARMKAKTLANVTNAKPKRKKRLAQKDPKRKKFGASKTPTYSAPKAAKTKAAKGLTVAQIKAKLKAHNSKCPVVKVTGTKTQLQAQLRKISAPSGLAGMAYARTAGMAYPRTAGHRGRGCGCR
jgi:hypothetical protein